MVLTDFIFSPFIRRSAKILAAFLIVFLVFSGRQQIKQMDDRFFQPSFQGAVGLAYYLGGDYAKAARAYRTHQRQKIVSGYSSGDPIRDALLLGDFHKARQLVQTKLTERPDDPNLLTVAGEIDLEDGRPVEALQRLSSVLEREPLNRDALLLAAVARARLQAYGPSIDNLKAALRPRAEGSWSRGFLLSLETTGMLAASNSGQKPLCLLAHYYRYLRIFDSSNASPAIRFAHKAIDAGDRPDDAYLTIGVVLEKEGKREQALQPILKAIEINPKNAEAYRWAASLYAHRGGDLQNEFLMWKGAFEVSSNDPTYRRAFINFLVRRFGDYPQALRVSLEGLEYFPQDVELLKDACEIYLALGEYERAIAQCRQATVIQPKDAAAYGLIGFGLWRLQRISEAVASYKTAMSVDPSHAPSHVGLAGIYQEQRQFRQAIEEYEESFRLGNRSPEDATSLCGLYLMESEYPKAASCLERMLKWNPDNKAAQHLYTYARKNLGIKD